jgi:hypothetical protein
LPRTNWEDLALAGIRRSYPREYRLAGEARILRRIRAGLETAALHGIPAGSRAVLLAIGCAIVPERDPEFHAGLWARSVLKSIPGEAPPAPEPPPHSRVFSRTLTIRASQMTALRETVAYGFRGRVLAHLARVFPHRLEELGCEGALKVIDAGIAKAAECEIRGEKSVAMLIDLVLVHGADFDRDGPLSWTAGLLRAGSIPSEARLGMIYRMMTTLSERSRARAGNR